jgi:Integrase core domain
VESFIGRFRDECLNQHWFGSLAEARVIEAWRQHYNRERPHSALGHEPPERFARRLGALGLDEGPRPSPALAPAPSPCYDVNGSIPPAHRCDASFWAAESERFALRRQGLACSRRCISSIRIVKYVEQKLGIESGK